MPNDPIRVCILGASFNTANMGVSVLAAAAIRCVLHRFPEAQITQMDYAQRAYDFIFLFKGKQVRVRFVNIRFSKKCYLSNNIAFLLLLALVSKVLPFGRARNWLFSLNKYMKGLFDTDLFVSLAGGDSFSDIYGIRRLLYTTLPQILALLVGKKLILLPQTIGPFKLRISKTIAQYILSRADIVYSRQRCHLENIRAFMGPGKEVRFCYDLGFDVEPDTGSTMQITGFPASRKQGRPLVGFNVSGLLMMGGYTQNNMFGLKTDYDQLVTRMIENLIDRWAADVLLIPHVFGPNGESDSVACEKLFKRLRTKHEANLGLLSGEGDYGQVKHFIGRCDFFVGARMHACIGALSQAVPALSIAYSDKVAGVMDSIGVLDLVVDARGMGTNEIMEVLDNAFAKRADLRSALTSRIPNVKWTIENALSEITGPSNDC